MSNTMKTIIFVISLFVFLSFFILINVILPPQLILGSTFILALLYMAAYIITLYSQALIKYLYTKSLMKNVNSIKAFPIKLLEVRERLILLMLPTIAVFMPMVSKRAVASENLWSLAYLVFLAIIIEVLLPINNRTLKVYVTDKGFAINGIDFRLELSVPFSYTNAVGWYPFERIGNYQAFGNKVYLYHTYDMGVITFECSEEEVKQIKGLLVSKKVPERRY